MVLSDSNLTFWTWPYLHLLMVWRSQTILSTCKNWVCTKRRRHCLTFSTHLSTTADKRTESPALQFCCSSHHTYSSPDRYWLNIFHRCSFNRTSATLIGTDLVEGSKVVKQLTCPLLSSKASPSPNNTNATKQLHYSYDVFYFRFNRFQMRL